MHTGFDPTRKMALLVIFQCRIYLSDIDCSVKNLSCPWFPRILLEDFCNGMDDESHRITLLCDLLICLRDCLVYLAEKVSMET